MARVDEEQAARILGNSSSGTPARWGLKELSRQRSNNISPSTRVDVRALGLVAPVARNPQRGKAQWQAHCTRREEAPVAEVPQERC